MKLRETQVNESYKNTTVCCGASELFITTNLVKYYSELAISLLNSTLFSFSKPENY